MKGSLWGPDARGVAAAAAAVRAGGVVGFPTDTVYGLACAATDPSAIERLYRIKGRPDRLPLILMGVEAGALAPFVR
ncbi:MAG: L-threonylcarbamoyladenylate synthase, partial [Candidatus Dormibacteria bacterium]